MSARALFFTAIGLAAAFSAYASDEPEEVPARPVYPNPPDYPAACEPASDEDTGRASVTVVYEVTADGRPKNVRARESSNPCFNDAAIAAIRNWDFEPRRVNGRRLAQEDVETTFVFMLEKETQTLTFDARPVKRVSARYPQRCMRNADGLESVLVSYTVTEKGDTEDVSVIETTNTCFNSSAVRAVRRWLFTPKTIDGQAVRRTNVQTLITFQLDGEGDASLRVRNYVLRDISHARRTAVQREDPEKALEILDEVEAEYGANFSQAEAAQYYYTRAVIRISVKDYRGALDDLRIVLDSGLFTAEAADEIHAYIAELEAVIAAQEAAQAAEE